MKIEREPNTQYILSYSYGKDSGACLGAIQELGWPLDRIVTADIWFDDNISSDLPILEEFKAKADSLIKERYGIEVEHVCATYPDGRKKTFKNVFYQVPHRKNADKTPEGAYRGFPMTLGPWCNSYLKQDVLNRSEREFLKSPDGTDRAVKIKTVHYIGIAIDEPERLARLDGETKVSPLAEIGWDEAYCRQWCKDNDLLSPIYDTMDRQGCWHCHNQKLDQLRALRHDYPDLWKELMQLDLDSPFSFKPDGRTVHDYDRRFELEDEGKVPSDRRFKWKMMDNWSKEK